MAAADLEHVTQLADALTPTEKQRLMEHLSQQLRSVASGIPPDVRPAGTAGGLWPSKFAASADILPPHEPPTESASLQKRIAGLNAGDVWMSADFNAELPDEFWLGKP